jgi:hypothetical protein
LRRKQFINMPKKNRSLLSLKLFVIFCGLFIFGRNCFSQEEKFKALFIYNFTKYIEWPANTGNEFNIAVIGNTLLVNELTTIASKKTVGSNSIKVISVKSSAEIKDCQIIFISKNSMDELPKLIEQGKNNGTLIITEVPKSCSQGAGVNFVLNNGSIKFEISRTNIESSKLKVSQGLLKLGIEVN